MPVDIVKSLSDKTGKSVEEVEEFWKKAKQAAKKNGRDEGDENFYPYVIGILKKMLGIKEEITTTSGIGGSKRSHLYFKKLGDEKEKKRKTFREYLET